MYHIIPGCRGRDDFVNCAAGRAFFAEICQVLGSEMCIRDRGDPMELFLRGYTLTLRKEDAHNITVREDAV